MKQTLTIAEAAAFVGRDVSRIYAWIKNGRLTATKDELGRLTVSAQAVTAADEELYVKPNARLTR